jgi:hypothetical protein
MTSSYTHCISSVRLDNILQQGVMSAAYMLTANEKDSIIRSMCERYQFEKEYEYKDVNKVDLYRFWNILDAAEEAQVWNRDAQIASIVLIILMRSKGIRCDTKKCLDKPEDEKGRIKELEDIYQSYFGSLV